jgi:hypothetical protein
MFLQLASTLHRAYRDLRKGRFNHLLSEYGTIKNIAAIHLLNDFGIQPLAHDLGASVAALLKAEKPIIRRFVVSRSETKNFDNGTYAGKAKTSTLAVCYVKFDSSWSPIEVGNPLEWAWELIPFSFVVDWAFPIGDWIGSLDAMKGVETVAGTVTTKTEYEHVYVSPLPPSRVYLERAKMSYKTHSRDAFFSIPLPPFPGYEPSQSFRNVAQGLSLLKLIHGGR